MRKACLPVLLIVAFLLGLAVRGEADDTKAPPTDAEVHMWVNAIEVSRGRHKADLIDMLSRVSTRAIPPMAERIQRLAKLKPTLTVCDVRDIRKAVRPKLAELESLLTKPSIEWFGDGKLIVRASRADVEKVGAAIDRLRASQPASPSQPR